MSRKEKKQQPQAKPRAAPNAALSTASALPMEIQIGDRFTEGEFEWEVGTRPAACQGGKSFRATIRRPGVPESETEIIWPAHVKVNVRRTQ